MWLQLVVLAVFFISGAAALVYEVIWMRQLALVFGGTTLAVTTVLASFMGGLALGSQLLGRRADRTPRLLLLYAALELGIGLYALAIPHLIDLLRFPYILLRQAELPFLATAAGRALLAGALLLPPTVAMGGTFPVLARLVVGLRGEVGGSAGLLYFSNTAGAVAGCALAGFWLIEALGLAGATRVAVATNLALAGLVAAVSRRLRTGPANPATGAESGLALLPVRASVARLALLCIGLSGFASLAYEVLWTRALLRYLYNSTYAFTTMLVTFLAGMAAGSWLSTVLPGRRRRPVALFAGLQAGVGLGFVASAHLFEDLMGVSSRLAGGGVVGSFEESLLAMFVRASLVLLAPAVCLGASVPLATAICVRRSDVVGATIGRVYAVNTLGSILGSLGVTFALIPLLGMQGTLTLLVALNLAMAVALAAAGAPAPGLRRAGVAVGALAVAVPALLALPPDLFVRTFVRPGEELVFYREGATDTVGVVERDGVRRIVYDDLRGTASTATYPWNFMLGHFPVLLHPGEPRRALHVCFGVGNSLSALAAHDSLERIDSVEISPHAIEAAPYFWTNGDVLSDPRVRSFIDDGRNFLLTSRDRYDVIELEPPETFTAGVISLYTREFYREAARHLAPGGLLVQWLPVGEAPLEQEKMLFRAFTEALPHATVWQLLFEDGPLLLVGGHEPLRLDYGLLKRKMQRARVRSDLWRIGVRDVETLLSMLIFDEPALRDFVRGVPPITDDRTLLDFSMPRYAGSGFGLGIFSQAVRRDGKAPFELNFERRLAYHARRSSPLPHVLANLDGEDPVALAERIRSRTRPRWESRPPPIPESAWRRW